MAQRFSLGFWLIYGIVVILLGFAVTVAQGAPFAYVINDAARTVSVIDVASRSVINTIPMPLEPVGVTVNPSGAEAYVTLTNHVGQSKIVVIDTSSHTISKTIDAPGKDLTSGVAAHPSGAPVYVVSTTAEVCQVNVAGGNVGPCLSVGNSTEDIAITPDGDEA
jgi:YVTN family beta-propeller protein